MKKKLIILALLTAILFGGFRLLYPQILLYPMLKYMVLKTDVPLTYQIPLEKQIQEHMYNFEEHYKLSTKWIELSTPWKLSNTKPLNDLTLYLFENDKGIIIAERESKFLDTFMSGDEKTNSKFKRVFGEKNLYSEYNFEKLCLNSIPNQVSFFSSGEEIFKVTMMVPLKSMLFLGDKVYSFSVNDIYGFQFMNTKNTKTQYAHIFDKNDRCIELSFQNMNQNEVDSILSSIQVVDLVKRSAEQKNSL